VRAAAVEDFLRDLKASGSADLNAVMTTLNDAGLCRETLTYWKDQGWVEVARSMPLVALRGERFSWDMTVRVFCGEAAAEEPPDDAAGAGGLGTTPNTETTEEQTHDDNA
jgi:hypothetical protein